MVTQELADYEEKMIQRNYKFGVLFCKEDQVTEDQMYNNGKLYFLVCVLLLPNG